MPTNSRRDDIMAMPVTVRRYTVDEVEAWPPDGNRYELLDGILLVTPAPEVSHQLVATRLAVMLANVLDPYPTIRVVAPGAIVRPPAIDLQPDILVFHGNPGPRWREPGAGYLLAVEVESPSTARYDRDQKRPAYFALGVAGVWRVDPLRRELWVSSPGAPAERRCAEEIVWTAPGIDVTFRLPVPPMFRDLD